MIHPLPTHARTARAPQTDRRAMRRHRWLRSLVAVVGGIVALVGVAVRTPANAAPPLASTFTGLLRADANTTAAVSVTFSGPPEAVEGTFKVASGAVLRDCLPFPSWPIGDVELPMHARRVASLPSGIDRYSFAGETTVAGRRVTVNAPTAELATDGSILTVPITVVVQSLLWPFAPCTRNWSFELKGPPVTPFGYVDQVKDLGDGSVRLQGWAIDPDGMTTAVQVAINLDAPWDAASGMVANQVVVANLSRPDVGAAYPGAGSYHGFDTTVAAPFGPHDVYVYAINTPGTHGVNVLLGVKPVTVIDPTLPRTYHVTANPMPIPFRRSVALVLTAFDDISGAVVPGTFTISALNVVSLGSGVGRTVKIEPEVDWSYYNPKLGRWIEILLCPVVSFQPQNAAGYSTGSWPDHLFDCN